MPKGESERDRYTQRKLEAPACLAAYKWWKDHAASVSLAQIKEGCQMANLKKQATGLSLSICQKKKKRIRDGGRSNRLNFHSSPRMICHGIKAGVQYVEFFVEHFVSRGKKVKDDKNIETPILRES